MSTGRSGDFCPRVWDGILCWESAPANTTARAPCPEYLDGFDTTRMLRGHPFVSVFELNIQCSELQVRAASTTSLRLDGGGKTWSEARFHQVRSLVCRERWYEQQARRRSGSMVAGKTWSEARVHQPHLPTIKLISKIGYTVSFISLIVAFIILASVRKLRCPRNSLHMHLFLSFILRALAVLVKDAIFVDGIGLSPNMDFSQDVSTSSISAVNFELPSEMSSKIPEAASFRYGKS
ncbi:hypothetical protein HPB47_015620 [Ixodes persulcatus]|uniref:Uncharacterized protein n=1 Tax=Ixodes persulcatus TaxID=34615 RepID=A0AC60QSZ2_IXOPE|nr:hypothetical protein HPB47_015620 [Ixodes persulcatus]